MQIKNITRLSTNQLNNYLKKDYILDLVIDQNKEINKNDELGCNRWLIESQPKRLIFDHIYGDLLNKSIDKKLKILDIGSGVTMPQMIISSSHELTLIDLLIHDNKLLAKEFTNKNNINLIIDDWFNVLSNKLKFDLVIANDIFPNVDQRLDIFLEIVKKITKNLRLVLTYHQSNKFYKVKRTDAQEIMYLKSWDDSDIIHSLQKCSFILDNSQIDLIKKKIPSLYSNGRSIVCLDINF